MKKNRGYISFCFAMVMLNVGFVAFGIYKVSRPDLYDLGLSSFLLGLNALAVLCLSLSIGLALRRGRVDKRQQMFISRLEGLDRGIKELDGKIASPAYAEEKEFLREELRLMYSEREATVNEYYARARV